MGDLIIWKLSLLYSLSRVVHTVVQRKQFTFVFRVENLCENAGERCSIAVYHYIMTNYHL